jgi:hypothetical protein
MLLTAGSVMVLPVVLLWLYLAISGEGFLFAPGSGTTDPVESAKSMLVLGVVIAVYATAVAVLRRDASRKRPGAPLHRSGGRRPVGDRESGRAAARVRPPTSIVSLRPHRGRRNADASTNG